MECLRHHGDVDAAPGLLDFAVNVARIAPPEWLQRRLAGRLATLGRYPSAAEDLAVRERVGARHGRSADEVLLLAGGAEGFALLPRLEPALAALIQPSFTEPEVALREAGVPIEQVLLPPPYALDPNLVPDAADLVIVGNPTNPTSVLHHADSILAMRRPGRIVVVDEAFADACPGETESVAGRSLPDVLVLRSLTKTWSLAGLRCGYVLGPQDLLRRLQVGRAHWPIGSLQLEAIAACCTPEAAALAADRAQQLASDRAAMIDLLRDAGFDVALPAAAPFLLLRVDNGEIVRKELREKGIAVRRCDTFRGLGPDHLRVAVRGTVEATQLVAAMIEVAGT
ncbi:Rv2231c family pyridoxal phosphate-dependent protein CobC [Antrihabitans cavernicola]|uniref:Threonine-phosphate decarboxylase n=1 Tax=Antrihabitans cavernicola TaxID=2495913 RepID=A0A5A7SB87_9NOCA|nr:threonine-phosphate decarboxylase [Spelaeibacter cavernicola]